MHRLMAIVLCLAAANVAKADDGGHGQTFGGEFAAHPVGYGLIGVGGLVSFISIGGLFAGGSGPDCKDEKNRKSGETVDDCKARREKRNKSFYSAVALTLGAGLATAGVGIAVVKWGGTDGEKKTAQLGMGVGDGGLPTLLLTTSL